MTADKKQVESDASAHPQAQHKKTEREGGEEPGPISTAREIVSESGVLVRPRAGTPALADQATVTQSTAQRPSSTLACRTARAAEH